MLVASCGLFDAPVAPSADEKVVTLLHINDVYEIEPVAGGTSGGLARIETLRRQLEAREGPVLMTLGGDFVSPSALGTARVDGQRLNGRQMVATLNATGLAVTVLGNHEFDVGEADFVARMAEVEFTVLGANATRPDGSALPAVRPYLIRELQTRAGPMRIAFIGVVIPSNQPAYVRITDPYAALQQWATVLRDSADVVVALTHLDVDEDIRIASTIPEIDLVLGGHEHENFTLRRGPRGTLVLKADANARSAHIVQLRVPRTGGRPTLSTRLVSIGPELPDDPTTAEVVRTWVDRAFAAFREQGFEPRREVVRLTQPLDGRESTVRNRPGVLTDLVVAGMRAEFPEAEIGIFNGGTIRIDDILPPGPITEYDIIRLMPFGDRIALARLRGDVLIQALDRGVANAGSGGYLQHDALRAAGAWAVGTTPIDPTRVYAVAIPEFLLTGRETNLDILADGAPGVTLVTKGRDLRQPFIEVLKSLTAAMR